MYIQHILHEIVNIVWYMVYGFVYATLKYLQLFAPFCLAQSCEAFNVFTRARKMYE